MHNNSINPNLYMPNQANPSMRAGFEQPVNPEALKQTVNDSYIGGNVSKFAEENPMHQIALMLPITVGVGALMNAFSEKVHGNYNNSALYKIGRVGDKITDTVNNSRFGGAAKGTMRGFGQLGTWLNKNIVDNVDVMKAVRDTPSQPTNKLVVHTMSGPKNMILGDFSTLVDNFVKPVESVKDLSRYGATKADITRIANEIKATPANRAQILRRAEFELVAKKPGLTTKFMALSPEAQLNVLQNRKARVLGGKNLGHLRRLTGDVHGNFDEIMKTLEKADKNMYAQVNYSNKNVLTKADKLIRGRRLSASEILNKLKGATGDVPHSGLGKGLVKGTGWFLEGATGRYAGGLLGGLMHAYFLSEVVLKTAKAEKGEKLKTFMERFIELTGFFITMPIAVKLMHRLGGIQYAGMSKPQVEAYRNAVKAFNEKALSAGFANKAAYETEKAAVKAMKVKGGNPLTRLLRWGARVLTGGLESPGPFRTTALKTGTSSSKIWRWFQNFGYKFVDKLKHPRHYLKNGGGSALRIIAAMFILMPFLNKIGVKISHAIFGRPKHSTLDKEEEKPHEQPQQQAQQSSRPHTPGYVKPEVYASPTNLLNQVKHPQQFAPKTISEPSTEKPAPVRTYVPSSQGVKVQGENYDTMNAALQRADAVEKMVMQTLAMK
jgi:hypothetical protein